MTKIILAPAPFVKANEIELPEGLSLNEISNATFSDAGIPQICRQNEMVIEVDGEYIPKCDWGMVPKSGSNIKLLMPLRGGGKSPLRILLSIAVVVASFFAGPELAAAYFSGSAIAAGVTSAIVMTAGTFLVNAIAPVRPQGGKSGNPKDAQAYSISGSRNQIAPYQPVPVVLGRHRFFPPLAAKPYTELDGEDEYIRILLAWCGPCKIEDIRIGDTPIGNFPGFQEGGGSSIEIREGWETDDPITLIPGVVNQTRVDIKLTNSGGWVNRIMSAGYDELSVEISFPQGLIRYNKEGKRRPVTVEWQIRWREVGSPDWVYVDDSISYPLTSRAINTMSNGQWVVRALLSGSIEIGQFGLNRPPGTYNIGFFTVSNGAVSGITNTPIPSKVGMVISQNGADMQITAGSVKFPQSDFTITGTTTSLLRRAYYGKVDKTKSYEIGLSRVTVDSTDERTSDEFYWTIFRGTKNVPPLNFPVPMSQIAMRIKASEGAQNQIDIINCIASSYAQRYVSGNWETSITDVSNNPAALFRGVLRHPANRMQRTLPQIDDATLGEWYEVCESEGYEFNQVREFTSSVWDCLADVSFAGRGTPALPYGKWSVDFDQATRSVKGHITPRNSWGFKSEKVLINQPHAFRVIFNNEDKEYLEDEIVVYDDGYDANTATIIERLEFRGVTNADLAWKFGRYHIAQSRLRPEVYTVFMDFEHLTFRRNDLIMVAHDVPRWSDNWGRVKEVHTSGSNVIGVTLDYDVTMELGEVYAIRFRLNNGTSLIMSVVNTLTTTNTLDFTGAVPIVDGPKIDNLCMFNVADTTAVELICLGLRRQHDLVAEVSFVDHAPEIYDADTGTIPPFNSHINGRLFPMVLPTPIIESIRGELYTEDFVSAKVKQRVIITVSVPPINIALINHEMVIRYRLKDSLEPWANVTYLGHPIVFDVPVEGVYEVIVKQKGSPQGLAGYFGMIESPWTDISEVTVQAIFDIGLPAPTNPIGWYGLDAQGRVSKVKLRLDVDISQTVPQAVALMVSIQEVPREMVVSDHGSYLKVISTNILSSGSFTIIAGSTSSNVKVATAANPLPDYDLAGFFWASLNGTEYRKATGSTKTAIQFASPFSTNPVTNQQLTWVELAWADERADEFKLLNLISASGTTEVVKWSTVDYVSGEYRIAINRAQEETTQISAVKAQYYPAPGAGTETIILTPSHFTEIATNSFEGSADVQITIPPGSYAAVTLATYVIDGLRVIRSPIIPITDWRPL